MRQVSTDTRLPVAARNAIVVAANIRCAASDCDHPATRWSNLCGLCERQFLEDMKPVFGKPTKEQLAAAETVIRDHYADAISNGVFDDWASQIGRTFSRPLSMLPAPLKLRGVQISEATLQRPAGPANTGQRGADTARGGQPPSVRTGD